MPVNPLKKDEAVAYAIADLASRLAIDEGEIETVGVESADFPDMSLGAGGEDEMSAQMLASGWRIKLRAPRDGETYEYRGNRDQLRLFNFRGANYKIK